MPSQPSSPMRRTMSTGKRRSRSCSSTTGATSSSMNVADRVAQQAVFDGQVEVHRWSLVRPHRPRQRIAPTDASLRACPSPRLRSMPHAPAPDAVHDPTPGGASGGPSGLRRDLLVRLRMDGPSSPDQLATRLGASRTGVLQQLRALEDAEPREPPDREARRRSAAAPVRRHAGRPGPLPVDLRRARQRPAVRDRRGRWRRADRGGLRRPTPPAQRPRPRPAGRSRRRPMRRSRTASAGSPRSRRPRAISPRASSSRTARSSCASTTAPSTTWPRARRRPARRSWTCSARCSAPMSCARPTSPPATAAAPTRISERAD